MSPGRFPARDRNRKERVTEFFKAVAPMQSAYTQSHISYVATAQKSGHAILKARLRLAALASVEVPKSFTSESVIAGAHRVTDLAHDPADLIAKICEGTFKFPEGILRFTRASMGDYHAGFTPLHDEGLLSQNRISVLTIEGGAVDGLVPRPELDWSLKAGAIPYDTVGELLTEFGVGALRHDASIFEIVADTVAFIDHRSRLSGADARVLVRASESLSPESVTVGYRVIQDNRTTVRGRLSGTVLSWTREDNLQIGEAHIAVPLGSVVHCMVSCGGVAQHQYYLLDPARLPNPMRTAFEAFDDGLGSINTILDNAEGRSYEARDLEAAVAWILAMHGFVVAHIGGTRKQIPGPDNLAMTPSGNFVIIECTTKHLGSDKKLPDLVANSEKLRRKLDAAGQQHRSILRVLVTSLRASDIAAETADAEKLGVLVLTRENLDSLLVRSITSPNADRLYEEGVEAVRSALKKIQA